MKKRKGTWALKLTVVWWLVMLCGIILFMVYLAGCGQAESFAVGFGTGVVAMEQIASDSQEAFVEAVDTLDDETAKLNTLIGTYEPRTAEAIEKLKDRSKDPITWIALASILGNAFWGGRASRKKVK